MSLGAKLSRAVPSLVGPPIANISSVMGQTKGGSPTHHEDDTIKVVYVTQISVTGGPTLESSLGWELAGESSEVRIEREIDRQIGASSAVMHSVYQTIMVKRELHCKAKFLIDQSVYAPTQEEL